MFKKIFILIALVVVPTTLVRAEFFTDIKQMLTDIGGIVGTLTTIAVALAFLYFFWGLAQFISKSGDISANEEGKNKMIWGVTALFVIMSIMGIIYFISGELGLPSANSGSGLDPADYDATNNSFIPLGDSQIDNVPGGGGPPSSP